jgi:hypothetical protein
LDGHQVCLQLALLRPHGGITICPLTMAELTFS